MELPEALAKIAELEGQVTTLTAEKADIVKTNAELNDKVTKLDALTKDQATNFKKLRDMTDKELEMYTEKEIELMKRTEEVEARSLEVENKAKAETQKQKEALIDNLANKYSRGDAEIAKQIKINLGKLNPELVSPATTEAELTPHVETAFNMLGTMKPVDAIRNANNFGGQGAPVENNNDFSTTTEGAATASALGLSQSKVENNNNNGAK